MVIAFRDRQLATCGRQIWQTMACRATSGIAGIGLSFLTAAQVVGEVTMPVSFSAVTDLPVVAGSAEMPYGSHPLQTLLRFDPEHAPLADIVLIHGGCWSADYDRDHAEPLAGALRDANYRVWLPEYRRVGDEGGGWPATWHDARDAIGFVTGHRPDAAPVLLVGHSAGGHLALLGATAALPEVAGVVALAPITDLFAYASGSGSCQSMTEKLMGVAPDGNEVLYQSASPAGKPVAIPLVLVRGTEDTIVPEEQVSAMLGARQIDVDGAGHFDLIHPDTPAFSVLLSALQSLLP